MLNLFPIQFLAPVTYLLLRVVLGILCIVIGVRLAKQGVRTPRRMLCGLFLIATGVTLVLGFMTQGAAITSLVLEAILFRYRSIASLSRTSILLMATISLTLFITGAGPVAFDLPI